MPKTYAQLQDWLSICDVCGFKFHASKLRKRWDGLRVCHEDWEVRHPSDFFRLDAEDTSVPWTRSEAPDVFLVACPVNGTLSIPGVASPGCMVPGTTGRIAEELSGTFNNAL